MSTAEKPTAGAVIAAKYRLNRQVGRGGMGAVWEAVHVSLDTKVAVKFIELGAGEPGELRQRFDNEARAAAQLRSRHIVQVFDHGVDDAGRPYIVMELLSGEPLDARLEREGTLTLLETRNILLQVARALKKAHSAGIVHRDLKPENIFLSWDEDDRRDVVKIVDFGIAKFVNGSGRLSSTQTGAVLGTPHFMSPEQARGLKSVDARSDLWALGVIGYRCLTGRMPFEGEAVGDLLVRICTQEPEPASHHVPLPVELDAWMARALAKEPESRFQSADELARGLRDLAGEADGPTSQSVQSSRRRTLPSPWRVVGVALALLGVGVAFGLWRQGAQEPVVAAENAELAPADSHLPTPDLPVPSTMESADKANDSPEEAHGEPAQSAELREPSPSDSLRSETIGPDIGSSKPPIRPGIPRSKPPQKAKTPPISDELGY